jgi:hypothetical protein
MKDFTPHTEALELKQLGFKETCLGWFADSYLRIGAIVENKHVQGEGETLAPTYSQAFRWFREKYKLKCCIIPLVCEQGFSDLYESRIHQEKHSISIIGNHKDYEEAELACLRKMIEIVKASKK